MLSLPQATHRSYCYWSAWRTRVLMSHKEHITSWEYEWMLLMQPKRSNESWTKYPAVEECLDGKQPLVLPPTFHWSSRHEEDRGVARQPLPSCSSKKIIDHAAIEPLAGSQTRERRCTKLLWGLCSGSLTSTAWLGLQGCPGPEALAKNNDAVQKL